MKTNAETKLGATIIERILRGDQITKVFERIILNTLNFDVGLANFVDQRKTNNND